MHSPASSALPQPFPSSCSPLLWERSDGVVSYPDALSHMEERVAAIRCQAAPELVWLTAHAPLYTAGTSARPEDLFNPHGYPTYRAGRGGQWTYHGPGQRVGYVMLDLTKPHGEVPARDVRAFVKGLENWIIRTLARLEVKTFLREGRVGVWCHDPRTGQEAKIAALGVRLSRWVSWHGIALNISPDLQDFSGIVPCGLRDYGVTSLERFHPGISMAETDAALQASWPEIFGYAPAPEPTGLQPSKD
ncbi:lipoyl(octanoyl) transferase LipB [Oecophyllibacter saccharovorans]|uniref:Octanoyltransferase n=1 Tax=Oecophyllibacter saccharovorans TaxID=2558360 RepID=A0A506UQY5_9PROT|nr:lipoyl(octanoyl) transferase LipB [Oecophyllibacter saccharovorans]TPW35744.1 lipoyl(octanoyl) transferase LipB [Oecophyllibacter saccharovorans]